MSHNSEVHIFTEMCCSTFQQLLNHYNVVREMLGHGTFASNWYEHQTLLDNVSLLTPEFLLKVNQLVVETGHELVNRGPGEDLCGRCDSFVVETGVHYPTDVNLLLDAILTMIRDTGRACEKYGIGGWRQSEHHPREVKKLFNKVRNARLWSKRPQQVKAYLDRCRVLVKCAEQSIYELEQKSEKVLLEPIKRYVPHAPRQIQQIDRRILQGETIPHKEKMFSLFQEHPRWNSKGKAGRLVELDVPVCIIEDNHQFILHHDIQWQNSDVDVVVSMVTACQAQYPDFGTCSFDRGFYSSANLDSLNQLLDLNALPRKGQLNKSDREREQEEAFAAARQQHPAVESAINNLEHRGLDRVRTYGREGFERTVGMAVLSANLHRLGQLLRRKELKRLKWLNRFKQPRQVKQIQQKQLPLAA